MGVSTVAVYGPVPFWMKSVSDCDGCRLATGAGAMDSAGGEADGDGCGVVSGGGGGGGVACIPAASSIEKNKPTPCCTRVNGCEPARARTSRRTIPSSSNAGSAKAIPRRRVFVDRHSGGRRLLDLASAKRAYRLAHPRTRRTALQVSVETVAGTNSA